MVYYREVVPSRAVSDDFTLHSRINSSTTVRVCLCFADDVFSTAENTAAVIGELEAGRAYEVLILAGNEDGEEQVGTRLILTTLSTTDNVVSDPSLGTNGTIIAAASASAVVVLLVIIVIVVVVIRRRQKATNKRLEEFGGAGGLVRCIACS